MSGQSPRVRGAHLGTDKPNLPTKLSPTKIACLKLSGRFPMGLGIPPLKIKILPESNPLKSRVRVWRLAVGWWSGSGIGMGCAGAWTRCGHSAAPRGADSMLNNTIVSLSIVAY